MTGPVSAADATVEGVQAHAAGLGLAWQMKIGTVLSGGDPAAVTLVMDGDNLVALPGVSMVGPLASGDRVYVMAVPPAGLYVSGYASNPGLKLTNSEIAVCNLLLTLGAAPGVVVPNLSITVTTVAATARYTATGFVDFDETVLGSTVGVADLYIDGVLDPSGSQALFQMVATTDRATVGQRWKGTLTPGSHTFELFAYRSAASGTQVVNALHSTLSVETYE